MSGKRRKQVLIISFFIFLIWFWFCIPEKLFREDYSTVLFDREGNLMGASISSDGQWRFPSSGNIPGKYEIAMLHYEDEYFYYHPGVNPVSLLRATIQNIRHGRVVSGGSTISMQVIRLSRAKARTLPEKVLEIFMALRLEIRYSKQDILKLYAANAPYGGNVVGLDAAAWRYYGRQPEELSWGEAATLAVLPNSPALIHPGRNRQMLADKRNRLLDKLLFKGEIDSLTAELAKAEPIPDNPTSLPREAPHLLSRILTELPGKSIESTIDPLIQRNVNRILRRAFESLKTNHINNTSAIVADVKTGEVLSYIGNVPSGPENGEEVDIIRSSRSTGSLLKPFLYAAMIQEGLLMPDQLVSDIPIYIDGFNPSNFSGTFDGMVPASEALYRSLNVPAVQLLRKYRYQKFHTLLQELGMSTLDPDAGRYGLSLILGGAEATLWDLGQMYLQMAHQLDNNLESSVPELHFTKSEKAVRSQSYSLKKAPIWHTVEAMKEVRRPDEEGNWREYSSSVPIAWKTGTSFGHRDAWAIGITPEYMVGVWAGNADGEGRPGLTGVRIAAPILFDIFSSLEIKDWFSPPNQEMTSMEICLKSGMKATQLCTEKDTRMISSELESSLPCNYHKKVHLSKSGKYRVTSSCYPVSEMQDSSWFVLPAVEEHFYASGHSDYTPLPPFGQGCTEEDPVKSMQFIYPNQGSTVYIPRELEGNRGKIILEVAHRTPEVTIYWHLDNQYVGQTKNSHQLALSPEPGTHMITLFDSKGEKLSRKIHFLQHENM